MTTESDRLNGSGSNTAQFSALTEKSVRHGFVLKVYGIVSAQLAVTAAIGALVMRFAGPMLKTNQSTVMVCMWLSLAATVALMCTMTCQPHLMRQSPTNYILLFLFTMFESVMVGFICLSYTQESVLIVLGVTAFVVVGLTTFACQTTYDFTGFGPYLLCALLALTGMGFCFMIGSMLGLSNSPAFKALHLVYAGLGVLIFSFYIIYDTQLIVGGKHETRFSIDDYCMAALAIYMDIIQLFLFLLQLLGQRK